MGRSRLEQLISRGPELLAQFRLAKPDPRPRAAGRPGGYGQFMHATFAAARSVDRQLPRDLACLVGMRTLNITFESLEHLPAARLFGTTGVYVLWSPNAGHRPTYLGEGDLLSRINRHVEWLTAGVTGIIAILDSKEEAELAEAALLWVAEDINRWPSRNSVHGKLKRIHTFMLKHSSLRLNVRNRNPFVHPDSKYSYIGQRAQISIWNASDGYKLDHPWNARAET